MWFSSLQYNIFFYTNHSTTNDLYRYFTLQYLEISCILCLGAPSLRVLTGSCVDMICEICVCVFQMVWWRGWRSSRKQLNFIKVIHSHWCCIKPMTERVSQGNNLSVCVCLGLMEHTKRLLRAFYELSQTHRGQISQTHTHSKGPFTLTADYSDKRD